MATTDSAQSLGPRFAPEDPTLVKPWKGLIDGSTGLQYYWNPEINVTQYEKPSGLTPPLPTCPPTSVPTPKLAAIPVPRSLPANGNASQQPVQQVVQQPNQQVMQQPSQQVMQQPNQQVMQQPIQQVVHPAGQRLALQRNQSLQQPHLSHQVLLQQPVPQVQLRHTQQFPYQYMQNNQSLHITQHHSQHFPSHQLQQTQYEQLPFLQGQYQPMPHSQGQQLPGLQITHPQGQETLGPQISHQKLQSLSSEAVVSQGSQPQGPQSMLHHAQQHGFQATIQLGHQQPESQASSQHQKDHVGNQRLGSQVSSQLQIDQQKESPIIQQQGLSSHAQHPYHQGQNIRLPRVDELNNKDSKQQSGFSSSLSQQIGAVTSSHHLSAIPSQGQPSQIGVHSLHMQHLGSVPSLTSHSQPIGPASSAVKLQPEALDAMHRDQRTVGPTMPNQTGQSMVGPSIGLKMVYEEDRHGSIKNEYYKSIRNEGPMTLQQQPKLAPIPLAHNHQESRLGAVDAQFPVHGHPGSFNIPPSLPTPDIYNHAPFPPGARVGPSPRMFGSSEFPNISTTDAYLQHHEVTAMGDNVPPPFMTFDATGFPPEILQEGGYQL